MSTNVVRLPNAAAAELSDELSSTTFLSRADVQAFGALLALTVFYGVYWWQPYFFGDELMVRSQLGDAGVVRGIAILSEYKPRLLYYSLLSLLHNKAHARWAWLLFVGLLQWGVAGVVYTITQLKFRLGTYPSLAVAALTVVKIYFTIPVVLTC